IDRAVPALSLCTKRKGRIKRSGLRKEKVNMEPTITQNGGLYALQHRGVAKYRSNLERRVASGAILALTSVMRCVEEFRTRLVPGGKPHASPVAAVGHFP